MFRILVFCGGGIGDAMMTTPMLRALRKELPDAYISVAIKQSINKEVLLGLPDINELIDLGKLRRITSMVEEIRKGRYTHSIHNHSCQMTVYHVLPLLAGIKNRIGFNRYPKKPSWKTRIKALSLSKSHLYETGMKRRTKMNLELLELVGVTASDERYSLYAENLVERDYNLIGFHPGSDAGGEIKRWPIERFVSLALEVVKKESTKVRFFLGPAEYDLAEHIANHPLISIVRPTSVKNLIQELNACSFFVSNDSGLSHLAAGHSLPTIVIYGPTKKAEYILPTEYYPIEPSGFDCTDCFRNKSCDSDNACLKSISVDTVLRVVESQFINRG